MKKPISLIGLVAAITVFVLIAVSYFIPWWQLMVGTPALAAVNISPLNLYFSVFDTILTIPLIWAINISCLLMLLAGGIIMAIYSIAPTKPYATKLLGYGYKQPLIALILFVVEVFGLVYSVRAFTGIDIPLVGPSVVGLPAGLAPGGVSASVNVTSTFGVPFFLAIAVVVLCITARLYHGKIAKTIINNIPTPPTPPTNESLIS
jgi:hypothetical protein